MKMLTELELIEPQTIMSFDEIIYPESDGKPMADNTKQYRAITTIQGNLALLYKNDPQVLVVGDLLWYPVKGDKDICRAPDVMVAFGVSTGDRGSYKQWLENNVAPQVVFEIRSPSNSSQEMEDKRHFYEIYGVLEYYMYDPDRGDLQGWQRQGSTLEAISPMPQWVSPLLGIRFDLVDKELKLYYPDGSPFLTFLELGEARQQAEERTQEEILARFAAEIRADEEASARSAAEIRADEEASARSAAEIRASEAEEQTKVEVQARLEAEEKAQAEAQARLETEERLRQAEEKLKKLGLL